MSKFLEIVESNNPEVDLDSIIEAKRGLQRMLIKLGVSVQAKIFKDVLFVTLTDGRIVELEVKGVTAPREEEAEDPSSTIKAITAIAGLPDQGLGKQLTSSTSRKLQMAKRNMASAAEKISKDFLAAANTTNSY